MCAVAQFVVVVARASDARRPKLFRPAQDLWMVAGAEGWRVVGGGRRMCWVRAGDGEVLGSICCSSFPMGAALWKGWVAKTYGRP